MPGLFDYASRSDWPKGLVEIAVALCQPSETSANGCAGKPRSRRLAPIMKCRAHFVRGAVKELSAGLEKPDRGGRRRCARSVRASPNPRRGDVGRRRRRVHGRHDPSLYDRHTGRGPLSATDGRMLYQALTEDFGDTIAGSEPDRQFAANRCLVGQPGCAGAARRRSDRGAAALRGRPPCQWDVVGGRSGWRSAICLTNWIARPRT